ncbi:MULTISPECIES: cold shock domain-containing protein [unclassified Massilia]|uniref:cold shock domain-containing protein n=1 Tax=unclassified Massilia TaxID=2609279 RepID=UPI001600B13D|nr:MULTISPECIES: cold shock domain-containing protein [unclassified Massilia]
MSYEFNSSDTLLNDFPNPFKFENIFMFATGAVTMIGAIGVVMTAKRYFGAHEDKLAFMALVLAAILLSVSVKTLVRALSQARFFLGRKFPLGLAAELPVAGTGVGRGTEDLLDTMRHRAIDFPEPQGALNGVLYSLVKNLITSPPQVQAAAVLHFHSLIAMGALLLSLAVSYLVFSGSEYEGLASWLYLPMCGLSLLAPFTQANRWNPKAQAGAQTAGANTSLWKLVGLVVFSIMAPVLIPRLLPAFAIVPLWIAPTLLLLGSLVASLLFFGALLARLDSAGHTGVSCEQTTIAMNCAPAQLWTAIGRDFQSAWERAIPNRAYANVPPDVSGGERGSFKGYIVEETQPVPTTTLQFRSWGEAFAQTSSRLLVLLGAWGTFCATAGSIVAWYYAGQFAQMERMQITRVLLVVVALSLVTVLSHKIGHLLWSRMQFKSRLYWIETAGTYQTSQLNIGNQFHGHTQSSSTLTRIEDATLRVWVTDIVSVVFGKDGQRSIIAMATADGVAKSMAERLVAFAADQSSVATPTSQRDLARAQSIGMLDAAVRGAAGSAQAAVAAPAAAMPLAGNVARERGKVKFFSEDKGFGFIVDGEGKEYFFNANYVRGELPSAASEVEFEPGQSAKGPIAKHVQVMVAV